MLHCGMMINVKENSATYVCIYIEKKLKKKIAARVYSNKSLIKYGV